jgi:hypothetical protein
MGLKACAVFLYYKLQDVLNDCFVSNEKIYNNLFGLSFDFPRWL